MAMRIATVFGVRPNFVKVAPLVGEMARHPEISSVLIHSGQHYDDQMSARFIEELKIPPPDFNLAVGSSSHATQTAEVMQRLEPVLDATRPDLVVVVGDVNSTLAAALTAVKRGIPVAHVEAGLRSFDRRMPEEINRVLTDAISEFLFATEESGRDNLLREGRPAEKIHVVGNVMIDALCMFRPLWEVSTVLDRLRIDPARPYGVLTLHRPSNVDDADVFGGMLDALSQVGRRMPLIYPVHPRVGPRLRGQTPVLGDSGIICVEPLGYLDFIALLSRAHLVLTDSGGIQEETTVLGVPCLTLRETTERPITVSHGTNRVVGRDPDTIVREALRTLADPPKANETPPLWDGRAAPRIVQILLAET
jgi:UDP-N-acetylglucosamine 2-epimerase (non-hydrolysing)